MKPTLAAILAGLAVYEAVASLNKQDGDTISEVVWRASTRRPLVPFAFGVLMGHFFWQEAKTSR